VNHNLVAIVIIAAVFPLRYVLLQTKQLSMEYVCYGYWVFLWGMHWSNRNSWATSIWYNLRDQKSESDRKVVREYYGGTSYDKLLCEGRTLVYNM